MLFMSGWRVGNCTVSVVDTTVQDAVRPESVPIFERGGHIARRGTSELDASALSGLESSALASTSPSTSFSFRGYKFLFGLLPCFLPPVSPATLDSPSVKRYRV